MVHLREDNKTPREDNKTPREDNKTPREDKKMIARLCAWPSCVYADDVAEFLSILSK
jgi:hypothetical protein